MKKVIISITAIMVWTLCAVPLKQKHVIGSWPGGLFSAMCSTLAHIAWATANNRIPVVYWGKESLYYQPEGYNGSYNVWEYYFEPLNNEQYAYGDKIHISYCMGVTCIKPFKVHSREEKMWANAIINEHIRIKETIRDKIGLFIDEHIKGKITVGIHLRGTDKQSEIAMPKPIRLIDEANRIAQLIHADQFLLLLMKSVCLNWLKKHYKDPSSTMIHSDQQMVNPCTKK